MTNMFYYKIVLKKNQYKRRIIVGLISNVVSYILEFKPYVLLPLIMLLFSLLFHIPAAKAIKSSLTIGIGFIGLFIIFDYFVQRIGPAVRALVEKTGLHFNVLDVGWTPLASITWSYKMAPLIMVLVLAVNAIMLFFKLTKTVNIDIWNFWHFIFTGAVVYESTGNIIFSIAASLVVTIITIKLADWSAPAVKEFTGLEGVSITTLSGVVYYPFSVAADKLLNKIPLINRINADPQSIKRRLGLAGEPMFIGFVIGVLLGFGAGYEVKKILEFGFEIAAVIYILPMMAATLGKGLMPISEGLKDFIKKKFPDVGETYIGLDLAVILSNPSVIVTGLLLMPAALFLAFILPGVNFIPLGDLANIVGAVSMVAVATRGNVVRTFIIFIPIIIGKLYAASHMAQLYTDLSRKVQFTFEGYDGVITSFLDGGNIFRFWIFKVFEGKLWALLLIPAAALMLYTTKIWNNATGDGSRLSHSAE